MQLHRKKLFMLSIIYALIALFILFYVKISGFGYGLSCFFLENYGITCLSCGATRAFFSLLHFDFPAAIQFNAVFALVIYPFIAFLIGQDYIITAINVVFQKQYQSLASFLWNALQKKKED